MFVESDQHDTPPIVVWPGHPQPLPNELLTSWLARVSSTNGLFVSQLLRAIKKGPSWERDMDVTAEPSLLLALSERTGSSLATVEGMRLTPLTYAGALMPINAGYRKRRSYGLQACKSCLEATTHYKRLWRVSLVVACHVHDEALIDRCPSCKKPLRVWQSTSVDQTTRFLSSNCFSCGHDLAAAQTLPVLPLNLKRYCRELAEIASADSAVPTARWCENLRDLIRGSLASSKSRKISPKTRPFSTRPHAERLAIIDRALS
jgi:hypothetical protein